MWNGCVSGAKHSLGKGLAAEQALYCRKQTIGSLAKEGSTTRLFPLYCCWAMRRGVSRLQNHSWYPRFCLGEHTVFQRRLWPNNFFLGNKTMRAEESTDPALSDLSAATGRRKARVRPGSTALVASEPQVGALRCSCPAEAATTHMNVLPKHRY